VREVRSAHAFNSTHLNVRRAGRQERETEVSGAHRPVEAAVAVAATRLHARDDLRYGVRG